MISIGFVIGALGTASPPPQSKAVIDSHMTRAQALGDNSFPARVTSQMQVVDVAYLGFDGKEHLGQIVVHKDVAKEVAQIFLELRKANYPIKKVVPIVKYGWSDSKSIRDNNTSAFNYRREIIPGGGSGKLSQHALGRAIDLNPYLNPFVSADGKSPRRYDPKVRGTLTSKSPATRVFLAHGWRWGGNGTNGKDYQHFVKPG